MADLPNLAGVATANLVEKIGGGNFQASYINWSRTLQLLREHAPGWLPELVPNTAGCIVHDAPQGAFLLIRFRHTDGTVTPEVPQAIMDHTNKAIPTPKITARDITDTHRRGACMAAALTFGLAYELWAKIALESGYGDAAEQKAEDKPRDTSNDGRPMSGVWERMGEEEQAWLLKLAAQVAERVANDADDAHDFLASQNLEADEKAALWSRLDSKVRTALTKAHNRANKKEAA